MSTEQRRILRRALALALVLVLAGASITVLSVARRARQHVVSAEMALGQLESALAGGAAGAMGLLTDPQELAVLYGALDTLDSDVAALENLAQPFLPLTPHLGWLPRIGGDVQAAGPLLEMARHTIDAAQYTREGLAPLAARLPEAEGGIAHLAPELVRGLAKAQPQVEAAQASLTQAAQARQDLDAARLSPRLQGMVQRFDGYLPKLASAMPSLTALPRLLGADGPRTYLLVAQNNQELRATGGFVSGVGLVEVDGGQITSLSFRDSYTVDDLNQPHPPPPDPLRREMGAGMLLMRDANWWPDFPTSAQSMVSLYQQDQGQVADGVIAVDLVALQLLLGAMGPVEVPGYEQAVTSNNLQAMMAAYWESPRVSAPGKEGADWWSHRKDFAADLLAAMLPHLMQDASLQDAGMMARAIGAALEGRHLLVYALDPQVAPMLRGARWDGALRQAEGDYLLVVDSNVGFNKTNVNVTLAIDYQVTLEEGGQARAELTLAYRHLVERPMPACVHESRYGDNYADLMERCYWDHLRVYVPAGSQLLEATGTDEPVAVYEESGRTVFATTFLLGTGQARRIQFTYRLNLSDLGKGYELLFQKQPGTEALPLRVTIAPPTGSTPAAARPDGWVWLEGTAVWQGDLGQDRELALVWE